MKVFNEERTDGKRPDKHLIEVDRKEGQLLIDMAEAAVAANPRKSSYKKFLEKLEDCLTCY